MILKNMLTLLCDSLLVFVVIILSLYEKSDEDEKL